MNDSQNLVTPFTFKEKLYLVKMYVLNGNTLELSVTDKYTAEEWRCSYDATYIESLTHKTGNFKQFDVFVTMLKSGLLKTSECVTLDLLTVEDLESLRSRRVAGKASCGPPRSAQTRVGTSGNRRYLILTYSVEFDRIHYPLPLEYCGPPDPQILQGIIRKLEAEVERLQDQLNEPRRIQQDNREEVMKLQKRVEELSLENKVLIDEVRQLNKKLSKRVSSYQQMESMQTVMKAIEEQVIQERTSFQRLLQKLRDEKSRLQQQVDQLRVTERSLRTRLRFSAQRGPNPAAGAAPVRGSVPGAGPARLPGDGLSPVAETRSDPRGRPRIGPAAARSVRGVLEAVLPPPRVINALSRRESCNHHTLHHSQSATCCHIFPRHHRSSSESSCKGSQKASPINQKSSSRISTNLHQNLVQQQGKTKLSSAVLARNRNGRTKTAKQLKHQRSCSECSSCSHPQSCSKRGSGSWSSSASSKVGRGGSGDRKHHRRPTGNKQQKPNKGVNRGMSDLEDRIKALQKLLKEGLPMK